MVVVVQHGVRVESGGCCPAWCESGEWRVVVVVQHGVRVESGGCCPAWCESGEWWLLSSMV